MSMRPERVAVNNQDGQSRMKPGERPIDFFKRLREERAAQDPAYAARLKADKGGAFGTGSVGEEGG